MELKGSITTRFTAGRAYRGFWKQEDDEEEGDSGSGGGDDIEDWRDCWRERRRGHELWRARRRRRFRRGSRQGVER